MSKTTKVLAAVTTSIFVGEPSTTCSVKGVGTGRITAIGAGTGKNG